MADDTSTVPRPQCAKGVCDWWAASLGFSTKPDRHHPVQTRVVFDDPNLAVWKSPPRETFRRLKTPRIDLQCQQPSGLHVFSRTQDQPAQHVQPLNSGGKGKRRLALNVRRKLGNLVVAQIGRIRHHHVHRSVQRLEQIAMPQVDSPFLSVLANVLLRDSQRPSAHVRRIHRPRSEDDTPARPRPPHSRFRCPRSSGRPRRRPRLRAYPNTASTRNSVSCRGTSTSGVTTKSSP